MRTRISAYLHHREREPSQAADVEVGAEQGPKFIIKPFAGFTIRCWGNVTKGWSYISDPPNVSSAWVPLVHVLVFVLLGLLVPWGIVYGAAMLKITKNGPIALVCGLKPVNITVIEANFGSYYEDYSSDFTQRSQLSDDESPADDYARPPSPRPPRSPPLPPRPPFRWPPPPPPRAERQRMCEAKYVDAFDYELAAEKQRPDYPNNTVFIAIVIQDVDVKKFVLSGLVRASVQVPFSLARNADANESADSARGIVTTPPIKRSFSLVIGVNGNVIIKASASITESAAALDNLPVFAERHTRLYPFDRYRAHIRLTVQLIDDKDELMSPMRLPFVAAVVQKGSGFKYHVRTPRENYLIALNGRDTFAEGSFLIWGSRSAISRFISIFIVLVMWLLSIIVFTQALYTVWYRKFDNSIEMATFTTALLFALPQLRNAQPGIPTEANLVIDMTGFIWNMALVSISCIIYIWSFYSKVVTHRRRSAKTSSKLQQQVPIVGDDDEVPPPMEEKQQEYAAGAGADDDVEETELNLAHSAPPVTVRSTNNIDDASSKQA